jgi:hypothetical protein
LSFCALLPSFDEALATRGEGQYLVPMNQCVLTENDKYRSLIYYGTSASYRCIYKFAMGGAHYLGFSDFMATAETAFTTGMVARPLVSPWKLASM